MKAIYKSIVLGDKLKATVLEMNTSQTTYTLSGQFSDDKNKIYKQYTPLFLNGFKEI